MRNCPVGTGVAVEMFVILMAEVIGPGREMTLDVVSLSVAI